MVLAKKMMMMVVVIMMVLVIVVMFGIKLTKNQAQIKNIKVWHLNQYSVLHSDFQTFSFFMCGIDFHQGGPNLEIYDSVSSVQVFGNFSKKSWNALRFLS